MCGQGKMALRAGAARTELLRPLICLCRRNFTSNYVRLKGSPSSDSNRGKSDIVLILRLIDWNSRGPKGTKFLIEKWEMNRMFKNQNGGYFSTLNLISSIFGKNVRFFLGGGRSYWLSDSTTEFLSLEKTRW